MIAFAVMISIILFLALYAAPRSTLKQRTSKRDHLRQLQHHGLHLVTPLPKVASAKREPLRHTPRGNARVQP